MSFIIDHNRHHGFHGALNLTNGTIARLDNARGPWPSDILVRICSIATHEGRMTVSVIPLGTNGPAHEVSINSLAPHTCEQCPHTEDPGSFLEGF